MQIFQELAQAFRKVYFGGNWCGVSLQPLLADVTWEEANASVHGFHTLAELTYHVHYYVHGVQPVLQGGTLDIRDTYSFDLPPVQTAEDWEALKNRLWTEGEAFMTILEKMPNDAWDAPFSDPKYGPMHANLQGILEHIYYHLGQMVWLKRMIREANGGAFV